jgi:hypothetical protein
MVCWSGATVSQTRNDVLSRLVVGDEFRTKQAMRRTGKIRIVLSTVKRPTVNAMPLERAHPDSRLVLRREDRISDSTA